MDEERSFDPLRHLSKVSGRDYLEVKWRVVWARTVQPDISIVSELVKSGDNAALFKATVSWPTADGIVQCVDYGMEEASDFADYFEKASTKAIGRALALAGFGTQFTYEHEFGADAGRVVDSPVGQSQSASAPRQSSGGQEATPRQLKYLHTIAQELGYSDQDIERKSEEMFQVPVAALSRRDVSSLIEVIQSERFTAARG